ncbi:MAG: DUF362 domain-containing protein [Candidatus Omnitrophica bacterium]|nr:DUF362 domain-containing protein [Candidatus Omnitrophota bacterium]MDD5487825.1 DUF362 domain-containing protein [Candidatus Omnitrophota bacterium]
MDRFFYRLECFLKGQVSRKTFLKILLGGLTSFVAGNAFLKYAFAKSEGSNGRISRGITGNADIIVAKGVDPYRNTVEAVKGIGGMGKFVRKGDTVLVKPNMAWDRTPEQAANTDPAVVAALVEMCYASGAKKVNVLDVTCNNEKLCYEHSGIAAAVKEKGANVYFPDHWNVVKAHFPYESPMEGWPVLRDAVDCDVFINVPVLKHHGLTGLTLSMKNLMGVCSGTRGMIHFNIGRKLADLTDFLKPDLTVIDATRVLRAHGPSGGDVNDVEKMDSVIVATDPLLADMYASKLFGKPPMEISYISEALARSPEKKDLAKAKVVELST